MAVYIKGLSYVSPIGDSFNNSAEPVICENAYFKCKEPDYKRYIEPMAARRMSRVVKMGIYAAKACLENARVDMPDAIVTGTGLGCVEDTEKFLINMIKNDEKFLTPTPFIQSTHNTVSSQISLFLKCHAYNVTYSHRGLSFESALLDSIMLLKEKEAENVLLGGIDEMTKNAFILQKRLGLYKSYIPEGFDILTSTSRGALAGEGAAFFCLTGNANEDYYAEIVDLVTWQCTAIKAEDKIKQMLAQKNVDTSTIDLLILGSAGDNRTDGVYDALASNCFSETTTAYFKHLSGDYQTASSFAMAMGAEILKTPHLPALLIAKQKDTKKIKNILIYNHFQNINHSLVWLRHD